MPIQRRARPITEESTALAFFTNRQHACRRFAAYLDGDTPLDTILFFYGDGGNGKSLLLRFLETYYCQGHDPRQWTDAQPDTPRADIAAVPTARLDFAPLPDGDESHQRAITGLLRLRRTLGEHGLHFPLFDYAGILYLKRTEGLSNDRIRALFPAEEADLVAALVDAIADTSYAAIGKAVLGVFSKYLGARPNEWFTLWLKSRGITTDDLDVLRRMDPERELLQELPRIFAEDLNAAMRSEDAPRRVVLFFDTHEAFWGAQRDQHGERYFIRDEWLRCLLATLDRRLGIVTVVAGRERPRWHLAERCPIDERLIEAQQIAHLSDADARAYLGHIGLADDALRERLLDTARVAADEVHPLHLGLCADIVRAAAAQGNPLTPVAFANDDQVADKGAVLLNRLLRYTDAEVRSAVEILSAARAFNRDLYLALGRAMDFSATRAAFGTLARFSFVWPASQRGGDWYHIHPLIRRVLAQDEAERATLEEAHAALEQHYRQQATAGDRILIIEAIYHANQQDWQRGVVEWVDRFDQALQASDYGLCVALIELRGALRINEAFQRGRVLEREGHYYAILARYPAAQRQYTDAITAYDTILMHAPDDIAAHTNKGIALIRLGELLSTLAQDEAAQQTYEQAITACDTVLVHAPDDINAHNNKGNALAQLGALLARLTHHVEAQQVYGEAIAVYDTALRLAPDDPEVHNNKGNALQALGELLATRAQHEVAQQMYEEAIAAYDTALRLAPDYTYAHNNKGNALNRLGDLLATRAQHEAAQQAYKQAITVYDTALRLTPDDPEVHNNKGNALNRLGDLLAKLAQREAAQQAYKQALAVCDTALRLAPDYILAYNNKGNALLALGNLLSTQAQHDAAQQTYAQALAAYDTALLLVPDYIDAHINKGLALQSLAIVLAATNATTRAIGALQAAIACWQHSLTIAPGDQEVQGWLEQAQQLEAWQRDDTA